MCSGSMWKWCCAHRYSSSCAQDAAAVGTSMNPAGVIVGTSTGSTDSLRVKARRWRGERAKAISARKYR